MPRILVAAPGYLTAMGTPQRPGDLADFACLSYRADAREEVRELSRGGVGRSHKATGPFSANNGDVLMAEALASAVGGLDRAADLARERPPGTRACCWGATSSGC